MKWIGGRPLSGRLSDVRQNSPATAGIAYEATSVRPALANPSMNSANS
jgi:hypothetical protein